MFLTITIAMAVTALAIVLLPSMKPGVNKQTMLIISLMAAVPFSGIIGYEIGVSRTSPAQPLPAANDTVETAAPDPLKMVAQLESKLKTGSGTPEQWAMLARSYAVLKRYPEAVTAYAKATGSITNDAQMYADYADALAMTRGKLDQESESLVDKALKIDPLNPKALALKATIDFDNKDYQSAIDLWEKLLTVPGLDPSWAKGAKDSIEETRGLMHPSNKSSAQVEAAGQAALKAPPDSQ